MKKILILITILLAVTGKIWAAATCEQPNVKEEKKDINTPVPKNLKGAKIIVRTKDGKETEVAADDFKVVPRKQQFVTTKVVQVSKEPCEPKIIEVEKEVTKVVEKERLKNRVSLLLGSGSKPGLTRTDVLPTYVEVESKVGLVGGIQYQRLVTERWSVGAQAQTNKTFMLNVGLDF